MSLRSCVNIPNRFCYICGEDTKFAVHLLYKSPGVLLSKANIKLNILIPSAVRPVHHDASNIPVPNASEYYNTKLIRN